MSGSAVPWLSTVEVFAQCTIRRSEHGVNSQGNRTLTKQDFEQVVVTPGGVEAFASYTGFEGEFLLGQIVENLA